LFDFVFGSLIDNAIKFSHEGGTITIGSVPGASSLTVRISDYGVGIPESKMSQLFKPFSRGTSAMQFDYEGLGFSLFLDKIIMDYLGGKIAAESVPNQSSTFSVTTATT
jgi:signal transduction histidine kinase